MLQENVKLLFEEEYPRNPTGIFLHKQNLLLPLSRKKMYLHLEA